MQPGRTRYDAAVDWGLAEREPPAWSYAAVAAWLVFFAIAVITS